MLAQPRKIRLVAGQAEATERELFAMRLQALRPPSTTLGKPTRTSCAISGAAANLPVVRFDPDSAVPLRPAYGGLGLGPRPPLRAPPQAPLQAAASAARPIDADRRQIFRDNSRYSGPWCGRTGFPLAL